MKFKPKQAVIIGSNVLTPGQEYDSKKLKVADKFVKSWIESGLVESLDENKKAEVKADEPKDNDDAGRNEDVSSGGKQSRRQSNSKSKNSGK
ncbi:hypothetical protein [Aeribacillus pallidus]|uniref:hypothetical protein n=1 Tax=Aeribacillus pallidus TaxID=33936 RepID=UPI003D194D64